MRRIDHSSSPSGPFLAPMTKLSSTVCSGKIWRSSGTKPRPARAMWCGFSPDTTRPPSVTLPRRAGARPMIAFHGGGLAGAVAAEQRHGLALAHRKRDAEQDLAGAVINVEILDLN